MKKILASFLFGAATIGFASSAIGVTSEAKATYIAAEKSASDNYKMARQKCDALVGNPKNVCIEEAKAAEKRSKADAEAEYKNTTEALMKARIAGIDADYALARARCGVIADMGKEACIKEAKAIQTKAIAELKLNKEIEEMKSEAAEDKRDADY